MNLPAIPRIIPLGRSRRHMVLHLVAVVLALTALIPRAHTRTPTLLEWGQPRARGTAVRTVKGTRGPDTARRRGGFRAGGDGTGRSRDGEPERDGRSRPR
jgi:hypothetical protein